MSPYGMKKKPEQAPAANEPQIEFVCEQDGNMERELKQDWLEHVKRDIHVTMACLARVRYDGSSDLKVALCLRADGAGRPALAERLSSDFRERFKTGESLDIIFLTEKQEQQLLLVARPFYLQAGQAPLQ